MTRKLTELAWVCRILSLRNPNPLGAQRIEIRGSQLQADKGHGVCNLTGMFMVNNIKILQ